MLSCIIVEDEFPAREELKYFIGKNKDFKLVSEFENPIDALNFLENTYVDVIFLDINMPEMNGVSLAKIIKKMYSDTKIIFLTAYKDYAVEAFEIKAYDYILKPYSEERINTLLKNLSCQKENNLNINKNKLQKITLSIDDKLHIISLRDIDYIEAFEKETAIYSNNKKYVSKIKISKWEEILEGYSFYRCHRSYIVNLEKITVIEQWINSSWIIKIKNYQILIPVSRNNIKELKEIFTV